MTTSLLKQYREFAKNDPEYQKAAEPLPPEDSGGGEGQSGQGRRKRSPTTLQRWQTLEFKHDVKMEKKWMQAYYPGAYLDPSVSSAPHRMTLFKLN